MRGKKRVDRPDSKSKKSVSRLFESLESFTMWLVVPFGHARPDFIATNKKTALEMSLHPETGARYCSIYKVRCHVWLNGSGLLEGERVK